MHVNRRIWGWAVVALCVVDIALADSFSKMGCFKSSSVKSSLNYKDSFVYQSSAHCEGVCSGKRVAALISGSDCYCGDSSPDESDEVDDSNCDTTCQGYSLEDCGGDGYFLVYVNSDVDDESSSSASSSSSSSSQSSSSSSTSPSSSSSSSSSSAASSSSKSDFSSSASSSASASSSSTTSKSSSTKKSKSVIKSTITTNPSQPASVIAITKTVSASPTGSQSSSTSSSSSSGSDDSSSGDDKKALSTGGIVGVAIGSVAGVGLLGGLLFLFLSHRRRDDDDEKADEFTLSGPPDVSINNYPSNFITPGMHSAGHSQHNSSSSNDHTADEYMHQPPSADITGDGDLNRISEEYGRRRISNGSLPDMARGPSTLKVVNN